MMPKSLFRATAILSSSSVISILLSLVSAKVMALYLHAEGYGYYGLLQSFVAVSALVAGMGMATGIVRLGAAHASQNDAVRISSLRRASWLLFAALSASIEIVLFVTRKSISQLVLGRADRGGTILLMGAAILFIAAANLQVGTLNSYHRVGALAKYGVFNTLLSSGIGITSVILWKAEGIPVAIVSGAVVTWSVSQVYTSREIGRAVNVPFCDVLADVKAFIRFGVPYTASMFVGTGVQLLLPILVLHLLNAESVGYYRAAYGISVGYLGFLITAMGQDYYPRLSAAANDPARTSSLINTQHRLVMLLVIPIILGTLALVPYLVPLIYSSKFQPTVGILEWQLIGDLFKFSSWTMSFAILARANSLTYFLVECAGGIATLGTTWVFVRWFGLPGLGVSFLATYVIYYGVVWWTIRREIRLRWTMMNCALMLSGVAAAVIVRILPSTSLAAHRNTVALGLAIVAGVLSMKVLWREYKESHNANGDLAPVPDTEPRPLQAA
jgi:O-antigen/teichoic acid export membrane protein